MDNRIRIFAFGLNRINPNKIDYFFNRRFETWLYKNSHSKNWLNIEDLPHLKFNPKGRIINAEFSKRIQNGLKLTENQFIEHELNELSKLNYKTLKTNEKTTYDFYKEYLETKPNGISIIENKYPNIFRGADNKNFEKFDYLFKKINLEDKTKISILYHYFKSDFKAKMTQENYLSWCNDVYGVRPSKIFQQNYTHEDTLNEIPTMLKCFIK